MGIIARGGCLSRGVLFTGGQGPDSRRIKELLTVDDVICAADCGLEIALDADVCPDGIVGDMDSLSNPGLLDKYSQKIIDIHPRAKDETDTELGLLWLKKRHCKPLVLIGGGEGRLDHTMDLLNLFYRNIYPDFWYTAKEEILMLEGQVKLTGYPGSPVSFYPVGTGPWMAKSKGLQWPLDCVPWEKGNMSLSNCITSGEATVEIFKGRFLVIRPLMEDSKGV